VKGTNPEPTTTRYRGAEYAVHLQPKIRIEIVVEDDLADAVRAPARGDGESRAPLRRHDLRAADGGRGPDPHRRARPRRDLERFWYDRAPSQIKETAMDEGRVREIVAA